MGRILPTIVLALLGIGLLAHPVYLSLPSGRAVHPTFQKVNASTCANPVAYTDLAPRARHSFDVTSHGALPRFNDTLYTGQHTEAVQEFREHDCIRNDGSHFKIGLVHEDSAFPDAATLMSPGLYVVGGLALIGAAFVWLRE